MKTPYLPPRAMAIHLAAEQLIATSYVTEQERVTTIGAPGASTDDDEELWGKSSRREGPIPW